ncbi:hypothetical protein LWI28_028376 [Acer negundo]|uniref:Uncharacterized protein n=1 Tax=Acer negundo TaxID=4023 RepID=A0AAD5JJL6_ACENE|nr:hypothetical protein LWI28_028376 [Acer negundo]
MEQFRLRGWQLIGELVENKLSYNELVEKTYILIGIDRNIYDIILYRIYVDIEKRVYGSGGGDGHVHKLPPSFFKYDNVGYYTTDFDTEDEKLNEHDYPSSPDDTFVRVENGVGVKDGIRGTNNCGGTGRVTFGGPSHDPFPATPSC